MARGGTGQAKKGAAVVGSFRGLCGSGREDSENPGRRRPGLGDVILVWQARVKSRDHMVTQRARIGPRDLRVNPRARVQ